MENNEAKVSDEQDNRLPSKLSVFLGLTGVLVVLASFGVLMTNLTGWQRLTIFATGALLSILFFALSSSAMKIADLRRDVLDLREKIGRGE